jgi:hypothetical protein
MSLRAGDNAAANSAASIRPRRRMAIACLDVGSAQPAPLLLGLALVLLPSIPWALAVTRRLADAADRPAE